MRIPEPIEFLMHLRVFHSRIATPDLTDAELMLLHQAEHAVPRSWGHHGNEYPISRTPA